MRQFQEVQLSLAPSWGRHQHSQELQMVARILDRSPELGRLVQQDLLRDRRSDRGRPGLSGDQVLRIALLKQIHGLSYRELEFHLQDSAAFRRIWATSSFVSVSFPHSSTATTVHEMYVPTAGAFRIMIVSSPMISSSSAITGRPAPKMPTSFVAASSPFAPCRSPPITIRTRSLTFSWGT